MQEILFLRLCRKCARTRQNDRKKVRQKDRKKVRQKETKTERQKESETERQKESSRGNGLKMETHKCLRALKAACLTKQGVAYAKERIVRLPKLQKTWKLFGGKTVLRFPDDFAEFLACGPGRDLKNMQVRYTSLSLSLSLSLCLPLFPSICSLYR